MTGLRWGAILVENVSQYQKGKRRRAGAAMTLEDLKPGVQASVREVQGEESFQQRLFDLGFLPGTPIVLLRKAPWGDPLEVKLRGYRLALRKKDAGKVLLHELR